jgi:hypothetical protein
VELVDFIQSSLSSVVGPVVRGMRGWMGKEVSREWTQGCWEGGKGFEGESATLYQYSPILVVVQVYIPNGYTVYLTIEVPGGITLAGVVLRVRRAKKGHQDFVRDAH